MVTLKDVAFKSGFSKSTVSFVLNDAPLARYIAQETKARIRQAAEDLGYRPNQFARSLRSKRSLSIGVIVFDISDPYCAQILRGVENALYKSQEYLLILADVQNDRARFERYVRMLLERQVDGLITLGNSIYPERELLQILCECRTPTVIIGRVMEKGAFSSVTGDNEQGAYALMDHLHTLGHRRIAFIRGPRPFIDSSQRWKGIESFASRYGLTLDKHLIVDLKVQNVGHGGGYELTRRLLRTMRKFTALVAYDDLTAFGAIRALSEAAIEVPRDCSVTGYDDVAISAYYNPPLTTIHQDMELQGAAGVEILLNALKVSGNGDGGAPIHKRLAPQIVVRASTAPPS